MKSVLLSRMLMSVLALALVPACGGGGGDGGGGGQPTTAVVTFATAAVSTLPANTMITGYDVTISLPPGITVKSTTIPPQTDTGVVTATGAAAGSQIIAVYSAATSTIAGKVRILIANAAGFSAGEFCKVNCDIAAGYSPKPSDFPQPAFTASGLDTSGTTVTTVDLTNNLSLTATAVIN